jgi:hypothetical protein
MGENIMIKQSDIEIITTDKRDDLITETSKKALRHKRFIDNLLGIVGMILIQGASVPTIIKIMTTPELVSLPELSLVGMVWSGLILYLIRSVRNFKYEWVYTLGNCSGLVLNGIMILYILS